MFSILGVGPGPNDCADLTIQVSYVLTTQPYIMNEKFFGFYTEGHGTQMKWYPEAAETQESQQTEITDSFGLKTFEATSATIEKIHSGKTTPQGWESARWLPNHAVTSEWLAFVKQEHHPILPLSTDLTSAFSSQWRSQAISLTTGILKSHTGRVTHDSETRNCPIDSAHSLRVADNSVIVGNRFRVY